MFEKLFHLSENKTTVKTELIAGLTTFMTMAYIIALNPNLLTNFAVGTPLWNGVFLATCIASAIGTVCMAFLANKPFVMNVYHCVSREQVEKYLTPLTDNLLMGVINELSAEMVVRAEDKAFIAQVYSYAFVGLMLDWIKDEMKQDPETLVNRFALVIQDDVSCALNRFRVDKPLSNPAD